MDWYTSTIVCIDSLEPLNTVSLNKPVNTRTRTWSKWAIATERFKLPSNVKSGCTLMFNLIKSLTQLMWRIYDANMILCEMPLYIHKNSSTCEFILKAFYSQKGEYKKSKLHLKDVNLCSICGLWLSVLLQRTCEFLTLQYELFNLVLDCWKLNSFGLFDIFKRSHLARKECTKSLEENNHSIQLWTSKST